MEYDVIVFYMFRSTVSDLQETDVAEDHINPYVLSRAVEERWIKLPYVSSGRAK
jgi:hypothetical protein